MGVTGANGVRVRAAWAVLAVALALPAVAATPLERAANDTSRAVSLDRSPTTGFARNVTADRSQPLSPGTASTRAEDRARAFLNLNRAAFIDDATPFELATVAVEERDELGMSHVRLQQTLGGIRVRGAEAYVHLTAGGVVAATSKLLPALAGFDTVPTLDVGAAASIAREIVAKKYGVSDAFLSTPELEIFDAGLLNDAPNRPRLAWFIKANAWRLNEYIWIDAQNGGLLASINQVTGALNRRVLDGRNLTTTPVLARDEGGAASTVAEVNSLYNFSGAFYNYFLANFNRDSFNGAGARITGIARACDASVPCPMVNAFWDGVSASFGAGFAVEDVVAHELSHAVVQFTADLIYLNESGALNESYADIFGETIQLTDPGHTTQAAHRWLIGEDLDIPNVIRPGIGFRSMMDPTLRGDPATTKSATYFCGTTDNGGVHTNSGVPNKAYALMADGGTFNGYAVRGIGLGKAAAVQYRALANYLVAASTLLDNYNGLVAACSDLAAAGRVTVDDCAQVKIAALAVQMTTKPCTSTSVPPTPPPGAPAPAPAAGAMCPSGQIPRHAYLDDFENSGTGNWTGSVAGGLSAWLSGAAPATIYATGNAAGGTYSLHGAGTAAASDSAVAMTSDVRVPANGLLRFDSDYTFETGFDAGVIEYSINAGSTWQDAGPLISAGRNYDGGVGPSLNNALAGRAAFTGNTAGYRPTVVNLSTLEGNNVRFRFRMATDSGVASRGWWIDNVAIFRCIEPNTLVVTPTTNSIVTSLNKSTTISVTLPIAPTQDVVVPVTVSRSSIARVAPATLTFTPANWNTPQTVTVTGRSATTATYTINFGPTQSTDVDYNGVPVLRVNATNQGTETTASSSGTTTKSSGAAAAQPWSLIVLAGFAALRRRSGRVSPRPLRTETRYR
jgi:Zn-dependent metalloprotease